MSSITLDKMLGIDYPIIAAPMFLISNTKMVVAALQNGITAAFPALNYRTDSELRAAIAEIRAATSKPFGVNLIVNKSNLKYKGQLDTLAELRVDFIVTSLGSPKEVIDICKPLGIKVFCDVVDLEYAKKVESLGADALIAVNNRAGGHAGNTSPEQLVKTLNANCSIPIISAGGIAYGSDIRQAMEWGAAGVSVGTIFIACNEADITQEYKQAMVDYGEKDIVRTTKLSGSALTVINTPYVQQLGTKANFLERLLNKNKRLKKYVKMLLAFRGMKAVEKAAFGATYKTVWCAGPAIEHVKSIKPMAEIVRTLTREYDQAKTS
ncbi:MAG TPA: nitronate monooxygenase [Cyclobacteriaceae bacterium]|nr:nitronate monooxygenase [Cyclobacteriaceae bacterium]HMV09509.1 nitronate monooxygenase [Cyclobacteriaceae bacterium]HMV91537.1 nitronate monooxygenase [Cyclobacteriaceae bacterium]HMX02658.1 nitronate monooxygenase [Cyclobacteriaceae bacterium]HMX51619.1 nitronate monooxygenase [Cyclobacteriaceae bacterium]